VSGGCSQERRKCPRTRQAFKQPAREAAFASGVRIQRGEDMAKGYWIARVDVSDMEAYKAYMKANAVPFAKYGAKFLVRSGRFESVEGRARTRNVVVEFESYDQALACWNSPEYQAVIPLRSRVSEADIIVIEGPDA
jgi:uncharacterized protein (DUF1330 family)